MSLEQEIKQTKPFKNNHEKTMVNIIFTNNWLNFKQNKFLKEFDISSQQYNVLRILNGQKGKAITINEIIERMLDKMSNASRLVDKLFAKGYVSRDQKIGNRRACDVKITPKGSAFLEQVNAGMIPLDNVMGDLTESEFDELNRLLDKLRG
ncbi:MarR family transcriptional regulator [Lacihabitans sp. LS3-19]|uniref:MarR family winged helix-turn-helix transcriptional regulator n=1 Tax=Lacihabitans sp. LS3-19 TaxID=2487335 RepID=UPI0020CCA1C6|nr:MarR family transcriptional regulator [Lacihabitans sp. LS3-19]MCP9767695.1 MarR family transcriptional regulator [Lacihabitans sp. LS3-19]